MRTMRNGRNGCNKMLFGGMCHPASALFGQQNQKTVREVRALLPANGASSRDQMLPAGVSPLGGLNLREGRPVRIVQVNLAPQVLMPLMSQGVSAECSPPMLPSALWCTYRLNQVELKACPFRAVAPWQ